jgi:hypothetical protein
MQSIFVETIYASCSTIKYWLAGLPAFDVCEPGQVGNEAATAN